jgi:hypothetical protein
LRSAVFIWVSLAPPVVVYQLSLFESSVPVSEKLKLDAAYAALRIEICWLIRDDVRRGERRVVRAVLRGGEHELDRGDLGRVGVHGRAAAWRRVAVAGLLDPGELLVVDGLVGAVIAGDERDADRCGEQQMALQVHG